MAVIAKIKMMPSSPDTDLEKLKENIKGADSIWPQGDTGIGYG